ncbi:hypothetical protein NE237_004050 [Protea cynaroides]|uniref:Uncharacterized protein n=1 Tax=Protea cynaroides TaxID=273540 RepID=A0A9Q0KIL2_9MAGN|nr:hypothetical protein NE237_004050 [Protea cynaroides]
MTCHPTYCCVTLGHPILRDDEVQHTPKSTSHCRHRHSEKEKVTARTPEGSEGWELVQSLLWIDCDKFQMLSVITEWNMAETCQWNSYPILSFVFLKSLA